MRAGRAHQLRASASASGDTAPRPRDFQSFCETPGPSRSRARTSVRGASRFPPSHSRKSIDSRLRSAIPHADYAVLSEEEIRELKSTFSDGSGKVKLKHATVRNLPGIWRELMSKDRNEDMMLTAATTITSAEVLTLVAHDLGHQIFSICKKADDLYALSEQLACRNSDLNAVPAMCQDLLTAAVTMSETIAGIRRLRQPLEEMLDVGTFSVSSVVDRVSIILRNALLRHNVRIINNIDNSVELHGVSGIFEQVLINLVGSSLESFRAHRQSRRGTISVSGRFCPSTEHSTVEIIFSDDGPGIPGSLTDSEDIFHFRTTMSTGASGFALPLSRSLLRRYLSGQIRLLERCPPSFLITIPASHQEEQAI